MQRFPSLQLLMASTSASTSPATSSTATSGRPVLAEPSSGQTLLDYPAGLLAAAYPRMAAAGLTNAAEASVYGSASAYAAAAAAQSYLPTLSTDPSVLYGSLAVSSQITNLNIQLVRCLAFVHFVLFLFCHYLNISTSKFHRLVF